MKANIYIQLNKTNTYGKVDKELLPTIKVKQ